MDCKISRELYWRRKEDSGTHEAVPGSVSCASELFSEINPLRPAAKIQVN
jgi:hypothetical protein